jgi:hypothetical protein
MNAGLGGCHRLDAHGTRKRHSDKDKFHGALSLLQIRVKRFILAAIRKTGAKPICDSYLPGPAVSMRKR